VSGKPDTSFILSTQASNKPTIRKMQQQPSPVYDTGLSLSDQSSVDLIEELYRSSQHTTISSVFSDTEHSESPSLPDPSGFSTFLKNIGNPTSESLLQNQATIPINTSGENRVPQAVFAELSKELQEIAHINAALCGEINVAVTNYKIRMQNFLTANSSKSFAKRGDFSMAPILISHGHREWIQEMYESHESGTNQLFTVLLNTTKVLQIESVAKPFTNNLLSVINALQNVECNKATHTNNIVSNMTYDTTCHCNKSDLYIHCKQCIEEKKAAGQWPCQKCAQDR
jgi:hypothetical protein